MKEVADNGTGRTFLFADKDRQWLALRECSAHFFVPGERELDEEIRQQEKRDREAEERRKAEQLKARQAAGQTEQSARQRLDAEQLRKRRIAQLIVSSGAICERYETIGLVVGFASSASSEAAFKRARERLQRKQQGSRKTSGVRNLRGRCFT